MKPKPTNYSRFTEALYGESTEKMMKQVRASEKAKKTRKKNERLGLTESRLQQQCVKWYNLQYPELYYSLWSTPNEQKRSYTNANRLKAQGLTSGISDLILCVQGKTYFIELKNPNGTGRQTKSQREFQEHITSQGFDYYLIDNFEAFRELIRGILK